MMNLDSIIPSVLRKELLRCAKISKDWIVLERLGGNEYGARFRVLSWLEDYAKSGADIIGIKASGQLLIDGPKMFRPTQDQVAALEHVDVNVPLVDYSQPYPAILVRFPLPIGPFHSALCHHDREFPLLAICLHSDGHKDDIVTTVGWADSAIEESLIRFDADVKDITKDASRALRVAVNSCLALSNYETHLKYLFPADVERDKKFARETSERGERAKERLKEAIQVIAFSQEVKLHQTSDPTERDGESGRQMSTHWRRGHWAMQPYGVGGSLRKRIFRRPVLVRSDLFIGDRSNTSTSYG